jgi:hypothetical protein
MGWRDFIEAFGIAGVAVRDAHARAIRFHANGSDLANFRPCALA